MAFSASQVVYQRYTRPPVIQYTCWDRIPPGFLVRAPFFVTFAAAAKNGGGVSFSHVCCNYRKIREDSAKVLNCMETEKEIFFFVAASMNYT